MRKGIILAGGNGTRLYPLTKNTSKHLLPIYDKPMIYYSLSLLMLAGIKEILIISRDRDLKDYQGHFSDGTHLGMNISYAAQNRPGGIPEGLLIAENFVDGSDICMVLGDNILIGNGLQSQLLDASQNMKTSIFVKQVPDPERFGVLTFKDNQPYKVIEKPKNYVSDLAVLGLYFLPNKSIDVAKTLIPSQRGELEIADLLNILIADGNLNVNELSRGVAWFDAGTPNAMIEVSQYVHTLQSKQRDKIACIEEIALRMGFITKSQIRYLVDSMPSSPYSNYLKALDV